MHFNVVYRPFDVKSKFEISMSKYLFLWCLFLAVKWIQKRIHRNGRKYEVHVKSEGTCKDACKK